MPDRIFGLHAIEEFLKKGKTRGTLLVSRSNARIAALRDMAEASGVLVSEAGDGELTAAWIAFRIAIEVTVAELIASTERRWVSFTRENRPSNDLEPASFSGLTSAICVYFPPEIVTRTSTLLLAATMGGGGSTV